MFYVCGFDGGLGAVNARFDLAIVSATTASVDAVKCLAHIQFVSIV